MAPRDRALYPASGFTLGDALEYYSRISKVLLPHLRRRPVSFKRYPDAVTGESFWEKNAPSFTPAWVRTVEVPRRGGGPPIRYISIDNKRTLLWVVRAGGIEIHPFLHRYPAVDRPASIVFDLDPGSGADITDCCEVAVRLREALAAIGFQSLPKVSGSKGLHVYVPLNTPATHEATEGFARLIAQELARKDPDRIVAKMARHLRAGKVFIDWSQNADYKTTIGVYSLRAKRERPFVSMPVTWKEVERANRAKLDFEPDEAMRRVEKFGDLFEPLLTMKQRLPASVLSDRPLPPAGEGGRRPGEGRPLPKRRSQSGRRLFVLPKTDLGNELWIDFRGTFKRFILRPDRRGGGRLIAMPAGEFAVDEEYYRGEVPERWKDRVSIDDIGSYEVIEGSLHTKQLTLYFNGRTLKGAWRLDKKTGERHRSWSFVPVKG